MSWRQEGSAPPTERQLARARSLRHRPTEPEKRLWWHLRHRMPTKSTHWRRQVPLGPYFADFCCLSAKLIVEADGNQHGWDENLRQDAERTRSLQAQGFRVLRFSNRDVMTSMEVGLDTILAALVPATPTPDRALGATRPSPHGGGIR